VLYYCTVMSSRSTSSDVEDGRSTADDGRWTLTCDGVRHEVAVRDAGLRRRITWWADGREIASRLTSDDHVRLAPAATEDRGIGVVRIVMPTFIGPVRRVALHRDGDDMDAMTSAVAGIGGLDLAPPPGSSAERRLDRIAAHPRRHEITRTGIAVLGVIAALLGVRLLVAIPWPDWNLPSIPIPSIPLPDIPWPDIPWPDIPWPSIPLPDVELPVWLKWILANLKYVTPVLIAYLIARGETRRRREARARADAASASTPGSPAREERDGPVAPEVGSTDDPGPPPQPSGQRSV